MFIEVSTLPDSLRSALSSVDYHTKDIRIEAKEKVSLFDAGGAGRRGFVIIVDLATERCERHDGSWGGANPYCPNNQVDLDTKEYVLPEGCAVIHGAIGYPRTFANITLHPRNIIPSLEKGSNLSEEKKRILSYFRCLTSAGRKEYLRGKEVILDELVSLGYLKRAKNGAMSITTAGKNECADVRI
jgi:hypothetical protein